MYDYLILPRPAKSFCLKARFFFAHFPKDRKTAERTVFLFHFSNHTLVFFSYQLNCTLTVAFLY